MSPPPIPAVLYHAVRKVTPAGRPVYRYVHAERADAVRCAVDDCPVVAVRIEADPAGGYYGWWSERWHKYMHVFPSRVMCEACSPTHGGRVERVRLTEVEA